MHDRHSGNLSLYKAADAPNMRIAILSDIHGNLEALEAVMESLETQPIDEIWFLGDAVGYGGDPEETSRLLAKTGLACAVRGNHDKVVAGIEEPVGFSPIARDAALRTRDLVSSETLDWLRALPKGPVQVNPQTAACHGSWEDEDGYIIFAQDAAYTFYYMETELLFFGHSHRAGVFAEMNGRVFEWPAEPNEEAELQMDARYLINPGSIGQPRDRDPRAAYALFDTNTLRLTLCRVRYDIRQAQMKIVQAGLPEMNALRLAEGR